MAGKKNVWKYNFLLYGWLSGSLQLKFPIPVSMAFWKSRSRRDTDNYPTTGRDVLGSVRIDSSRQSRLGPDTRNKKYVCFSSAKTMTFDTSRYWLQLSGSVSVGRSGQSGYFENLSGFYRDQSEAKSRRPPLLYCIKIFLILKQVLCLMLLFFATPFP